MIDGDLLAWRILQSKPQALGDAYHITSDEALSWNVILQSVAITHKPPQGGGLQWVLITG